MASDTKLTEAEIEHIAERAAVKALEKVYQEIGKSVANKIFWALGVVVVGALMWVGAREIGK